MHIKIRSLQTDFYYTQKLIAIQEKNSDKEFSDFQHLRIDPKDVEPNYKEEYLCLFANSKYRVILKDDNDKYLLVYTNGDIFIETEKGTTVKRYK